MKTDELEQFIVDNQESFGPGEPAPDVWNKIKKREPEAKTISVNWKIVMSRAAAIAFIFTASYYFHEYRSRMDNEQQEMAIETEITNKPFYRELAEAEQYYTAQINSKKEEFYQLTSDAPDLQKDIASDLTNLDAIFLELKEDLKDNAANQEVIEAMIQNYMLKLEILEDMLEQIKPKNENDDDEQTYSI